MKKTLLMFVLLMLTITGNSQSDFRKGYIIFNSGDTLPGYIEYRGNKSSARKCVFTKDHGKHSVKTTYTPEDIKAYRIIDSKFYVTRKVESGGVEQLLFLEYLINGKVDIFYYRDESGEHYFIDNGDSKLIPLTNEEKDIYKDNIHYQKTSNKYIGVLKYVFRDSPEIAKSAEDISLNHKSLIHITKNYHNAVCKDEVCIIYEKNAPRLFCYLGPLAGASLNILSKITENYPTGYEFLSYCDWEPSVYPSGGIFLNFNLPYLNERMYFQYDATLNYSVARAHSYYYDDTYPMNYYNDITYSQYTVLNSISFKYEVLPGKFRPVIIAGGFIGFNFKKEYLRILKMEIFAGEPFFDAEITDDHFNNIIYGINIGIGCSFKIHKEQSMYADLKYYSGLGLFQGINTNIISLNVGIPFKL